MSDTCSLFAVWRSLAFLPVTLSLAQLVKNLPAMRETWIQSPGEGKGYPLQYSGLEKSRDCIVHEVTESQHNWATFTHSLHCEWALVYNFQTSLMWMVMSLINKRDFNYCYKIYSLKFMLSVQQHGFEIGQIN